MIRVRWPIMTEMAGRGGPRLRAAPSLSFWVAGPLVFALLVFVVLGIWIAAWAIEGAILTNELGVHTRTHDEWTRRMNDRLIEAEASVARYGRILTMALQEDPVGS